MQALCRTFWLFVLLILASRVRAYMIGPLNTASLLEQAPLACRVQVLSVRSLRVPAPRMVIDGGYTLQDGVATVAVSRVLKGNCPQQLTIAVHTGKVGEGATRLHVGEWALVFLVPIKGIYADSVASPEVRKAAKYVPLSPVNGTLEIPAPAKSAQGGETEADPQVRLWDELVQAAENKEAPLLMCQRCIEQIGMLAVEHDRRIYSKKPYAPSIRIVEEPRIAALLAHLRKKATDPITDALYQTTALQLGVFPTVKEAVGVLSTPTDLSIGLSGFPMGDQPFTLSYVQHNFVETLRIRKIFGRSDTFDDAAFCHEAFQTLSVQQDIELREGVGDILFNARSPRSIPDAAHLLYDRSQSLRSIGVGLLRVLVDHDPEKEYMGGLSAEEYVKQEPALLRHWKKWWEAQPKPYK